MKQARIVRGGLGLVLAGSIASAGCTHNYYYGAMPACTPATAGVGGVQYGQVCEVPTQVIGGGSVVAQGAPPRPTLVGPRPPRVVVSEPTGGGRLWKRSDPDSSQAITRVEGAFDDPTLNR